MFSLRESRWIALLLSFSLGLIEPIRLYSAEEGEAAFVHILIVADTLGNNGKGLGLDLDAKSTAETLRNAFTQQGLAEGPNGRFKITQLDGENASEQNIFHYLRDTKIAAGKDTLVFYYTGHGGFYLDRGHRFNLRNWINDARGKRNYPAEVDRSDLLAAMARHQPRALIVLTDCCANADALTLSQESRTFKESEINQAITIKPGKGEIARDLFFRSEGVINITAARTGTLAQGDRKKGGSCFTIAMNRILKGAPDTFHDDSSKAVTWKEIYPALIKHTEKESWQIIGTDQGEKIGKVHTPEWFLLGQPVRKAKGEPMSIWMKDPPLAVVEEELTPRDPKISLYANHQGYAREYPVQLDAEKAYLFRLHSAHFDTYLYIKDENGKIVDSNDDYGGTTRSRVLFSTKNAGKYLIGVTSFVSKETGPFTLTAATASYQGELKKTDQYDRYRLGSHAHYYAVHLQAGKTYTLNLEAFQNRPELDMFLRIEDRFGNTLAMNDDEDRSNRLNSLLSFRPNFSSTYFVVANTMIPNQTGRYALFIQD